MLLKHSRMAVLGEAELQQVTVHIISPIGLATRQLAHRFLHFLRQALGRKRRVLQHLFIAIEARGIERRRYCFQERLIPLFPPLQDSSLVPQQLARRASDEG